MKKVALALYTNSRNSGEHQYALMIAECLRKKSGTDWELIVVCTNIFWRRWCRKNNIRYVTMEWTEWTKKEAERNLKFPLYSRFYNMYMTKLGKFIGKEKIDILFLVRQTMYVPNLNVKVITAVHDLMHRYEPMFPEVRTEYEDRELLFNLQIKYADCFLTDSKLGKLQFMESYTELGQKLHIISLPYVAPQYILEIDEEYIETPDKYIFYPAQFWKHKNHINLIKAIKILKDSISDIYLVLVGSEKNCYKEIERYIIDNGLQNNIAIKGFVSGGNLKYLYKHAVGLIMPSYFGPTNIPPLEAMALGCPVAVSNKYAMPEQIGKAGLTFDPDSPEEIADCIEKLWKDEKLREEMREKGYLRVSQWTTEDFEKRVFRIMESVAKLPTHPLHIKKAGKGR